MKRRNFSASSKKEAVNLVREQGRSPGKAAEELGISESALQKRAGIDWAEHRSPGFVQKLLRRKLQLVPPASNESAGRLPLSLGTVTSAPATCVSLLPW